MPSAEDMVRWSPARKDENLDHRLRGQADASLQINFPKEKLPERLPPVTIFEDSFDSNATVRARYWWEMVRCVYEKKAFNPFQADNFQKDSPYVEAMWHRISIQAHGREDAKSVGRPSPMTVEVMPEEEKQGFFRRVVNRIRGR